MKTVGVVLTLAAALTACTGESAPSAATIADTQPPRFEALPAVTSTPVTEPSTTRPPLTTTPRPTTTLRTEPIGDADGFEFGPPRTVAFTGLPVSDGRLSPDGGRLVINRGDELCILDLSDTAEAGQACAPTDGLVFAASMAWSPDGSRVLFHHDPYSFGADSDIMALDVASMTVERLTDDGVTDIDLDAGALFDLSPFHTPDGRAFFLRMVRENGELVTQIFALDESTGTRFGTSSVKGLPASVVVDAASGLAAFEVQVAELLRTGIAVLDPATGDIARLPNPPTERGYFQLIAVAGTRVLATSLAAQGSTTDDVVVVDLTTGSLDVVRPPILNSQQNMTGLALAPDGESVLMIIDDRSDADGNVLVTAPILDDGTVGEFGIVARGADFAPNDGNRTIRPAGLDRSGRAGTIGWRSDRLVYALGPNRIVILPIIG